MLLWSRAALVLVCLLSACEGAPTGPTVADRPIVVDPFIGSGGLGRTGSAFVGAAAPHGLAKPGPDTWGELANVQALHCSGYWYGDDTILGFSQTHLHGTGLPDYGVVSLMPLDGYAGGVVTQASSRSKFDKQTEIAEAGYYAVTLARGQIRVEMTATPHVAHHRVRYPAGATRGDLFLDLGTALVEGKVTDASVTLADDRQHLSGQLHAIGSLSDAFGGFDLYFSARAPRPWDSATTWSDGVAPSASSTAAGKGLGVVLSFADASAPLELQIGLSFTSAAQARRNLEAELPGFDFDGTHAATAAAWQERIGRVAVEGGTAREQRILLAALYHLFLMPTIVSDVDGTFRGVDGVEQQRPWKYLSDLSLWDTYRTVHPLYGLIARQEALDSVRSLVEMARAGGYYPKWPMATGETGCMLGSSAEVVIADAHAKGLTDFDTTMAYERMRQTAIEMTDPPNGRGGRSELVNYVTHGYVTSEHGRSVSVTTELSYDDFALAGFARALGHDADADMLLERSHSYRNLYDPQTGFLRRRSATGEFPPSAGFEATEWTEDYAEANAWQSFFYAPHDIDGLAGLVGGRGPFVAKLEEMFDKSGAELDALDPTDVLLNAIPRPYYWGGNQPDIQAPFMFAQAGRPDLSQKWARWCMDRLYGDGPDGLPGNDDAGTLSAWFVFAAMGLYPLPGTDRYIVSAPLFPKVTLGVEGGAFTITAKGVSSDRKYVKAVKLDGRPLETPELRQADLHAGGTLELEMGTSPSDWGR